ncbi:WD40 repeat domain-containing protein [Streptomyces sp. ITFR-16]|uniref:WD40 repeat domain-containing protein n=1 Tax=Streptomyces sp. ITFR-16 TaxID=3075198 RepID=UPI00288B4329|nr:WD40 repeat domain-containing protein [Streptomyces sp. ITFR-16]WNI26170.1 WD40 repeat domain-containing protein [Streptomyces sp. ITFR-16]
MAGRKAARRELLAPAQPALRFVRARVAAEDVGVLRTLRDQRTQVHELLAPRAAAATTVRALEGVDPYPRDEPAAAQALRASAAMALALVDDAESAARQLRTGLLWLRHCQAHPAHPSGTAAAEGTEFTALLDGATTGHAARIRRLLAELPPGESDLALPALLWLLSLDDALPDIRTVAGASVLFDDGSGGTKGVRATLRVSVLPGGPPALVPDPRTMSGFRGDTGFAESLRDAWTVAGGRVRGTVLWSLTGPDGVVGMVADRSLGCAFAVLIGEAGRRSGRWARLPTVRRLNPRTALVGALDGTSSGGLVSVGGYVTKLGAADNGRNVILPAADRKQALEVWQGDESARLIFASTADEAARRARVVDGPGLLRWTGSLVVLATVAAGIAAVLAYSLSKESKEEARNALAADLSAEALTLRQTDPRLAGLLGLAGNYVRPGTPRAVQAMRDVLEANTGVRLSWRASPAQVDSVAVDDKRGRVYTTGDDPYIKSWDLHTGKALGKVSGPVGGLVLNDVSGLLAARDSTSVLLYEALDRVPVLRGRLPVPTCARADSRPVANAFTDRGVRLVEVRDDGTMAQYDTTTRTQTDCRRLDTMGDLGVPGGRRVVVDADVALGTSHRPDREPAEEQILLLLTNNTVLSVGLDRHKAAVEIDENDVQGTASRIGANDELVVLATPGGVQAWDRVRHRQLSFPVGGLATAPEDMVEHSGSVVIASESGTVLVPLGTGGDAAGSRGLERPRGGPSLAVAAGAEFTVVAAGRGGRVNVLDANPGPLGSPTAPASSAGSFGPDGELLLTDFSGGASAGLYTTRQETPGGSGTSAGWQHVTDYRSREIYVNDVAMGPRYVAAAGQYEGSGTVRVWRRDGTLLRDLRPSGVDESSRPPAERIVTSVRFVPEADLLIARHVTGPVTVWSTRTWKEQATVPLTAGMGMEVHGTTAVALEQPGEAGARLAEIDLRHPRDRPVRTVAVPNTYRIAWSRDGSRLALLVRGNTVRYLDTALRRTGSTLRLPGGTTTATAVALSPDGSRVATGFADQVLVHDTATGLQSMPALPRTGDGEIIHLYWSPDDRMLAAVTRSFRTDNAAGPLNVWPVGGIDWRKSICRWTGGEGLTPQEWAEHIGNRQPYVDLCAEEK